MEEKDREMDMDENLKKILIQNVCEIERIFKAVNIVEDNKMTRYYMPIFLEDIRCLTNMIIDDSIPFHFCALILRNILEQYIEFLYCQGNAEYMEKYFSINLAPNTKKLDAKDLESLVTALKKICGEDRFGIGEANKRMSISAMTKDLESGVDKKDQKLYQTYSLLADVCHNSYYVKYLDSVSGSNILTEYREVFAGILLGLIEIIKHSVKMPDKVV